MPPNGPDDTSSLERLRQRLYAPQAPESTPAPTLRPQAPAYTEPEGWTPPPAPTEPKKPKFSWPAIFLGAAGIFFLIALVVAAYFLVFGGRAVSTERIALTVDGQTAVGSGDVATLLISVENRNPVTILNTSIRAEFPETARSPEDNARPFVHYEDTMGDVPSGETATRSVRVVLYGGENERVMVPVRFEYRVEGSNATYVKETKHEILISSSPLSIRAEAVSEASVGQPITFAVTVRSNAKEPLENVAVYGQYPFGFTPARGQAAIIPVGTLAPGEERTVTVTGTLSGEDNEERVLRFSAGTRTSPDANLLAVTYATAITPVTLAKPFLATSLSFNRDTSATPVLEAGAPVQGIISWINTTAAGILDAQVTLRFEGNALDTNSIAGYGGFYRSSDRTIIYSRETEMGLARLDPGATGSGSFSFKTKSAEALVGTRSPSVDITVSVAGRRVGEGNVPETINASLTRTLKVGTSLALSGRVSHRAGPLPPIADQESRYAIVLALSNTVNTVADATVTGTLPSYVRFVSSTDPSITYNETSRTVTWKAGEVASGAGFSVGARQGTFEVAVLPSASQRGTSPVLMSSLEVRGVDRYTQGQIEGAGAAITTDTSGQGTGTVR